MLLSPETRLVDIKPSPGPTIMGKRGGGGHEGRLLSFSPRPCFTPLASWEVEVYSGAFSDMRRCKSVLFQKSPAKPPPTQKGEKIESEREREREKEKGYFLRGENSDMPLRTFTRPLSTRSISMLLVGFG